MGRKIQSGRSPNIRWGGRGGKAGEGSTIASRVEAAPPEWKRPTLLNRNKKVDQNNLQPKLKRAKQANESDVQPGETGMEHRGATFSIGDRDGLAPGGESREGTELSRTQTYDVGFKDNVVDIKGADPPSAYAEDEMTTIISPPCSMIPQMHQLWFSSFNLADYRDTPEEGKGHKMAFYLGSMRFMDVIEPHNLEDHLIARERRGERTVFPWQATLGYLQLFESVSHQFAENPEHVTGVVDEDEPTLFRMMPKTSVTVESAIAMADTVITFLFEVEEEEEDMATGITTHSDGATTSTVVAMAPQTSVEHASEVRG
ncbi:hypothetical protein Syun_012331 [Stephania yunnanensis]|uniref:Uncharacterized protein n=1 Tax=Stephania yunnanensis TaxID=152371 RepID=A0AAP0PJD6_9MAGN